MREIGRTRQKSAGKVPPVLSESRSSRGITSLAGAAAGVLDAEYPRIRPRDKLVREGIAPGSSPSRARSRKNLNGNPGISAPGIRGRGERDFRVLPSLSTRFRRSCNFSGRFKPHFAVAGHEISRFKFSAFPPASPFPPPVKST